MRLIRPLVLAFAATGILAAQSSSPAIPFRSTPHIPVIVPVLINGVGPFDFILDTGSSSTSIDPALMQRLHLTPSATTSVTTLTGRSRVLLAEAEILQVGSESRSHVELLVRDLSAPDIVSQGIRGILGENFLRNTDYLLDHRHHTLQFDPSGTLLSTLKGTLLKTTILTIPQNRDYTHMLVQAQLVPTQDQISHGSNGHAILLLDSGASSLILSPQALRAPPPAAVPASSYIEDDNGRRKFVTRTPVELWFGPHRLKADASETDFNFPGWTVDGFLPTACFNSIYISNSGGFILIDPAHSHHRPPDTTLATLNPRKSPPQPPSEGNADNTSKPVAATQ